MTEQGRKGWNRRLALGGGAAAALGVGGYWLSRTGGRTQHAVTPAGVFHRGNMSDPGSLDPTYFQSESEQNLLEDLMVGLMTSDPAAKPIPGMATELDHLGRRLDLDLQTARGAVVGRHAGDGGGFRLCLAAAGGSQDRRALRLFHLQRQERQGGEARQAAADGAGRGGARSAHLRRSRWSIPRLICWRC